MIVSGYRRLIRIIASIPFIFSRMVRGFCHLVADPQWIWTSTLYMLFTRK